MSKLLHAFYDLSNRKQHDCGCKKHNSQTTKENIAPVPHAMHVREHFAGSTRPSGAGCKGGCSHWQQFHACEANDGHHGKARDQRKHGELLGDVSPPVTLEEFAQPVQAGRGSMIAGLYVMPGGVYWNRPGVDAWDEDRDARRYHGPWPVVAHPPCERWGRYWGGSPTQSPRLVLGDDDGCFEAALAAVRRWGGVLEHPEGSHAWRAFELNRPPRNGGWVVADWQGGWTCCVEQGHYGHRARKATWLYVNGFVPPALRWGPSDATAKLDAGYHSAEERRRAVRAGAVQIMSKRERKATPPAFADLLLGLAAMARQRRAA